MQIGDFVTLRIVGRNLTAIRQGVVAEIHDDGTVQVHGESGEQYHGQKDASVVSDHSLWGSTAIFVQDERERLGVPTR